jgi:hypothetical protein
MSRHNTLDNTFEYVFITGADEPLREQIEAYRRDEFLLEHLTNNRYSYQEAAKIVRSTHFVVSKLAYSTLGLETILVDKHCRATLIKALLARDAVMIEALERYVKRLNYKGTGGRPPIVVDGKSMLARIVQDTLDGFDDEAIAQRQGTTLKSVKTQQGKAQTMQLLPPQPPKRRRKSASGPSRATN